MNLTDIWMCDIEEMNRKKWSPWKNYHFHRSNLLLCVWNQPKLQSKVIVYNLSLSFVGYYYFVVLLAVRFIMVYEPTLLSHLTCLSLRYITIKQCLRGNVIFQKTRWVSSITFKNKFEFKHIWATNAKYRSCLMEENVFRIFNFPFWFISKDQMRKSLNFQALHS